MPLSARARSCDETAVRKPRLPILMPRIGVREPAISRATRSIVPSPPKTSSKSTWRARVAALGQTTALRRASWVVTGSLKRRRPAAVMRRAALLTTEAQETFSEFPISPTCSMLSANLFNQNKKFLIPGRACNRRLGDVAPAKAGLVSHEFFQLAQNALVDDRVPDDACATIHLGFAGLELRFDQRDDLTGRPQQCNGWRQDFPQRNE